MLIFWIVTAVTVYLVGLMFWRGFFDRSDFRYSFTFFWPIVIPFLFIEVLFGIPLAILNRLIIEIGNLSFERPRRWLSCFFRDIYDCFVDWGIQFLDFCREKSDNLRRWSR